jgi:hypothetical protein
VKALQATLAWMMGLVLALMLVATGSAHAAPATAGEVLADEAFGFCHDPQYPLTEDEAAWCPLLPTNAPPCPAFRAACKAPRAVIDGPWGPQGERTPGETKGDVAPAAEPEPRERAPVDRERQARSEPEPTSAPSSGPLPHVLVWIIVGGMVIALLAQLRGPAGAQARHTAGAAEDEAPAAAEPDAEPPAPPGETDVDRLLARALQRAERGELAGAVADGHAALLRRLAEHGHIRLLPSRTNGDHVRDLRGEPALREPTQQVVRLVERVQFGHAPVTRTEVDRLLAQVRAVLGTLAGAVLLLWISLACTSHAAREYPWSHSPSGAAGVLELLRSHGITVEYRATSLESLSREGPTPIVLDRAGLTAAEESALVLHVRRGGWAMLATREPLPVALGVRPASRQGQELSGSMGPSGAQRSVVVPGREGLEVDGPDVVELQIDEQGTPYAIALPLGQGMVVVLADDRLLTNAALAVPENGDFLVELLHQIGGSFELVDGGLRSVTGDGGASDPFDAMARAELTPVIGQLLLLMLLLYLWRGVHFGRPRDPPPPSRRHFGEHVEALAQQYLRAGARRHALRLYAGWALERIQERFGGQRRGLHHLARRIAARTGCDETEIMRTLVEAHHARDDDHHDAWGTDEDLRVLRELGRLIDTTRGTTRGPP